ncbi:hypothetical protein, partial [Nocardia barduliensis]|uniref:hypothetical protein n=1 Tax=Nocardia barduliensis TaxID=2736643 RepID=UPI001C2D440A
LRGRAARGGQFARPGDARIALARSEKGYATARSVENCRILVCLEFTIRGCAGAGGGIADGYFHF